jgi:hypothetical protein
MHWELAPAFTTADRDMATSAPMGLKDAPVAGKQSLELLCIHEYILLHTSVEVYISVERPRESTAPVAPSRRLSCCRPDRARADQIMAIVVAEVIGRLRLF